LWTVIVKRVVCRGRPSRVRRLGDVDGRIADAAGAVGAVLGEAVERVRFDVRKLNAPGQRAGRVTWTSRSWPVAPCPFWRNAIVAGGAGERAGRDDRVVPDFDAAVIRAVAIEIEIPGVELVPADPERILDVVVGIAAPATGRVGIVVCRRSLR
jgi:hypothetical protein